MKSKPPTRSHYSTPECAEKFGAKKQTPLASLHRKGHWMGMVPLKFPNGRLAWPADAVEQLLNGEG